MVRYDEKFKKAVVKEYLSGASGYRALEGKHGVDQSNIRRWVDVYRQHGDAGLRKKFSHYSARFKLSVLRRMWRQELSYSQVVALFDLRAEVAYLKKLDALVRAQRLAAPKKRKP